MEAINGLDEDYGGLAEDTDLEWRFKALGLKIKSARFTANVFHLYHKRLVGCHYNTKKFLDRMYQRKNNGSYICDTGLKQH